MKRAIVLLLLIACVSAGCAPSSSTDVQPSASIAPVEERQSEPTREQDSAADSPAALASLESLGGRLLRDESGRVQQVDLSSNSKVRDDDLELLQKLPTLEALSLSRTAISDVGLVHLRDVPSLVFVDLSHTRVTDDGLAQLADLPNLRAIQLHGTQTNPARLNSWQGLKSPEALRWLTPSYAAVRARGVPHEEEADLRRREIGDYQRVLEGHPDEVEALYRVATQRLALERLLAKEDLTPRVDLLRRAVVELRRLTHLISDSEHAEARIRAHHQLGRALKHQGDLLLETTSDRSQAQVNYDQAVSQFRQVLSIDPEHVDALGEIVLVYLALDDPGAGLAAVRDHLEATHEPRSRAKMQVMLGQLLAQNGKQDEAVDSLESALESDERALDAYMVLFQLVAQRDGNEAAIDVLRRAVDIEPKFVNGHLQLGQLLVQQGESDAAIASFESAIGVPTSEAVVLGMVPSPNVYRNQLYYKAAAWLAWLYLDARDQPERALQAVAAAKKFQPADAHLMDTEGWIYVRLGEYQQGRDLLQQAVQQLDSPTTWYHLAKAHFELGQWASSERCLLQALDADQSFPQQAAAATLLKQTREMLADRQPPR